MRAYKSHKPVAFVIIGGLAIAAAAGGYLIVKRPPPDPPPPAPKVAEVKPTEETKPAPPPATKKARKKRAPHREQPLTVASKKISATALPHKATPTDSKSTAPGKPTVSKGPLPEDLPASAAPLTEEEMKQQAEAQIDADGVRFVVKTHMPQVRACYERAFKDGSPGGRVEIGFAIQPDGKAARVRTEENTTGHEGLSRCLETRVKEWQFPRPVGGDYELVYPFVFAAGS
jgi:hypothetical protein